MATRDEMDRLTREIRSDIADLWTTMETDHRDRTGHIVLSPDHRGSSCRECSVLARTLVYIIPTESKARLLP